MWFCECPYLPPESDRQQRHHPLRWAFFSVGSYTVISWLKLSPWGDPEPPCAPSLTPFSPSLSLHPFSCSISRWFRRPMAEDQYLSACHLSSSLLVLSRPQKPPLNFKVHRRRTTLESTRHLHVLPFSGSDISGKLSEFCCKTNA